MNISPKEFVTKIRNKEHLPGGLVVSGSLNLRYCTSLKSLPDNLEVHGHLNLYRYKNLKSLPDNLEVNGYLGLTGCTSLKSLPYNIRVEGYIYCEKELIDTIPKEDLPLYINFKFEEPIHENFTHRIRT